VARRDELGEEHGDESLRTSAPDVPARQSQERIGTCSLRRWSAARRSMSVSASTAQRTSSDRGFRSGPGLEDEDAARVLAGDPAGEQVAQLCRRIEAAGVQQVEAVEEVERSAQPRAQPFLWRLAS